MRTHSSQLLAGGILGSAMCIAAVLLAVGGTPPRSADAATATTTVTIGAQALTIDDIVLNNGTNITLTEDDGAGNGFTFATATVKISGGAGCTGITAVDAKLYLASTSNSGTTCTADDNTCYVPFNACVATTTGGATPQCTGGGDNDVWYDCGFKLWYLATPTDAGTFINDIWSVAATTSDTDFATTTATNSGELIDVLQLYALRVNPASIAYGTVDAGSNTGSTNETTAVLNSGNVSIDLELSGDVMCTDYPTCSGGVMQPTQQKYATVAFNYSTGGSILPPTTTPVAVTVDLTKPTATTTPVTDDVLWGIAVPGGQSPAGDYTGENVFVAIVDKQIEYVFDSFGDVYYNRPGGTAVKINDAANFGAASGIGPQLIRTAGGVLYAAVGETTSCELWRSADNGQTWSEQDSADNPACASSADPTLAIDGSGIIHMVYRDDTLASSTKYVSFNTGTGQFGTEENVYTSISETDRAALAIDGSNIPHVVVASDVSSGTDFVYYTNRIGGSWKSPVTVNSTTTTAGSWEAGIVVNEDSVPEIAYYFGSATLYAAEGNQNDATSFTNQALDPGVVALLKAGGIGIDSAGNTWIAYKRNSSNGDLAMLIKHNDTDAWSTWQAPVNDGGDDATNQGLAIMIDNTDIYIFYTELAVGDLVYNRFDGSSWFGETITELESFYGDVGNITPKWSFHHNH